MNVLRAGLAAPLRAPLPRPDAPAPARSLPRRLARLLPRLRLPRRSAVSNATSRWMTSASRLRRSCSPMTCMRRRDSPASSAMAGIRRRRTRRLAHDKKKGFIGKPTHQQIPEVCGKCHGDAAAMKQFNPSLRMDQLSEYRTSGHGKKLADGRPGRRAVRELPRGARNPAREGHAFSRLARPSRADLQRVPRERRADDEAQAPVGPVRRMDEERPLRGAREGGRLRADLQLLPRQPRRGAAGSRQRRERLRNLPRDVCREPEGRARTGSPSRKWAFPGCVVCHDNHGS